LTKYADVPIEPLEQTELLNKMEALPGVLIAGVPGAGGYDAVFTLTIGKSPIANLQDLWQANSVIPLLQGGAQQGLGVQLESKTSHYYNILNSITTANNSQSPPKL
jgi:phosphomevalonate kinase